MSNIIASASLNEQAGHSAAGDDKAAAHPLATAFRCTMSAIRRHRAFRKAEAELMSLDDRMLRDIGIDRSEIVSVLLDTSDRVHRNRHPRSTG
ncbi:MAG: DUF1127 domain-containing protein [Hyphomicrobiaceae bacterium]